MSLPDNPTDAELLAFFSTLRPSPIVGLIGFRAVSVDSANRRVRCEFTATPRMENAIGSIQGGLVTAMLDQGMTAAALVAAKFRAGFPTLEIKTSFLTAARPGILTVDGQVVRQGRSIMFLAGEMRDPAGKLIATASSTTTIFERPLIELW